MLLIKYEAETGNDTFSPLNIANAVIENVMEDRRGEYDIEKAHRNHLNELEEIARHILIYVEAQRRIGV